MIIRKYGKYLIYILSCKADKGQEGIMMTTQEKRRMNRYG